MKTLLLSAAAAMVAWAPAATAQVCLTVTDEQNPEVTLTGVITKKHQKLGPESELRPWDGFYLRLDKPMVVSTTGGGADCYTWKEVAVDDLGKNLLEKRNNYHVRITGTLSRPTSALVYPSVFLAVSVMETIK